MIWLDATQRHHLTREEPNDSVIPWRAKIRAHTALELTDDEPESFIIGRMLADEIRRFEVTEWGEEAWEVADADSQGWSDLYSSFLNADGDFCEDELETLADPIVYLYRFDVHPDFAKWKMAALDAFCRLFSTDAIIVALYRAAHLSLEEFKSVGFQVWNGFGKDAPSDPRHIHEHVRWMLRDNSLATPLTVADYPKDCPDATVEHAKWVKEQGRIRG
ncbi:MAG: hypothetical protein JNL18_16980 [Planctomycetaceae bacterium]|nr:hypothetical protein [Planctomycetaceae bacterium]